MVNKSQHLRNAFAVIAIALIVGCGPSDPAEEKPANTAPPFVSQGWVAFQSGDFNTAANLFILGLSEDADDPAAHNGLGWALLKLNNLQNAMSAFDAAVDSGFDGADPQVGRTIILRDTRPVDFNATIAAANAALASEDDFVFEYDNELDWKDVRLVLAQSLFAIADYEAANEEVTTLGGTRQDPSSPTFVADLLAELQSIGRTIGS